MKRIGTTPTAITEIRPAHWTEHAACTPEDTELFFAEGPAHLVEVATADARDLCLSCPVMEQCLLWAVETRQEYGLFGGLTATERARRFRPRRPGHTGGGRRLAPCGTPAAYERHVRNREPIDDACAANHARPKTKKENA